MRPETLLQSRLMKLGVCESKMSCCGIFCDPQKGSERKGKVCSNLPSPGTLSRACHVPILYSVQKRLLQLCTADEPS